VTVFDGATSEAVAAFDATPENGRTVTPYQTWVAGKPCYRIDVGQATSLSGDGYNIVRITFANDGSPINADVKDDWSAGYNKGWQMNIHIAGIVVDLLRLLANQGR